MPPPSRPPGQGLDYHTPVAPELSRPAHVARVCAGIAAGAVLVLGGIYCTIVALFYTGGAGLPFISLCVFLATIIITLRVAHVRNGQGRWRGVATGLGVGVALGVLAAAAFFVLVAG